jgi:hypothetical protein
VTLPEFFFGDFEKRISDPLDFFRLFHRANSSFVIACGLIREAISKVTS